MLKTVITRHKLIFYKKAKSKKVNLFALAFIWLARLQSNLWNIIWLETIIKSLVQENSRTEFDWHITFFSFLYKPPSFSTFLLIIVLWSKAYRYFLYFVKLKSGEVLLILFLLASLLFLIVLFCYYIFSLITTLNPLMQWFSTISRHTAVKLGYKELGYNEHSVITNKFLCKIGHFSIQMNPVITKPGYNEQKWLVPSCLL